MRRLLDFETTSTRPGWWTTPTGRADVTFLDFLRDIGKHFSVNMMVAKEASAPAWKTAKAGISYTEFSYMLLQAYDFYLLCRDYDCELQIGGSDQWGNITAGIDLCRKKLGQAVFGLTLPLITNADGSKFGKTEAGAIWLDPATNQRLPLLPVLDQHRRPRCHPLPEVLHLPVSARKSPDLEAKARRQPRRARGAQRALARAVTDLVHGADATPRPSAPARSCSAAHSKASRSPLSPNSSAKCRPRKSNVRGWMAPELPLVELLVTGRTRLLQRSGPKRPRRRRRLPEQCPGDRHPARRLAPGPAVRQIPAAPQRQKELCRPGRDRMIGFVTVTVLWVFSVCLHEFGHAITAFYGGDTSVREKGYLTLNPIHYTHPVYSLLLPVVFLLLGGIGLPGGAVYINDHLLRSRWWRTSVSLAGPMMNLAFALVLALPLATGMVDPAPDNVAAFSLAFLIQLQFSAMLLCLLPIPPLDGFQAIAPWLPEPLRDQLFANSNAFLFGLFLVLWYVEPVNRIFWTTIFGASALLGIDPALGYQGWREYQFWR